MGSHFKCNRCGQIHQGPPLAYGADYPAAWYDVPGEEREDRVSLGEEQCIIDDRLFLVRARICIPVVDGPGPFEWGVWVSLSEDSFRRMDGLWGTPGRESQPPYFGWLQTNLPCYPSTLNLKTHVHTRPVGERPTVVLEPTDHPLAVEQRTGITMQRVEEIATLILHDETYRELRNHLQAIWPTRDVEAFDWTHGPIQQVLPNFRVLRIAPEKPGEPWIYASMGAWEVTGDSPWGVEFVILSPVADAIHVETLAWVAQYHSDPKYRLNVGSTINIGRPWMDGATCSRFLVSLPYFAGPRLEICRLQNRAIRFLWLLPITDAEWEHLRAHGQAALEQRLEAVRINPVDPKRPSAV